jgi:single-strand DNA-binding protein
MNKVILIGRIGHTPELKYSNSGVAICRLTVATSEKVKKNGEWIEETEWHDVVVFGNSAEFCQKYVEKGSLVSVEGRIKTRTYTGKDGVEKRKSEIISESITKEAGNGSESKKQTQDNQRHQEAKKEPQKKNQPVDDDLVDYDDCPF